MDASQPLDFLSSLLDQIAKEDPTDVFEYPVDGEAVKGYYDKIKQPMCFYVMREKLRKQEYRTWRGFTKDFELICENAKLFNPPQHRVHKLAINLQRVGRKILQTNELPGRRCLNMLHPEGPRAAAAEEAAEILVTKNDPQYSSQSLLAPAAELEDQQLAGAAGTAHQLQAQRKLDESAGAAAQKQHKTVPEDLAEAAQLWDATYEQLGPADWGLLFRELPDPQLDNVTQQLKQPVVYQPYTSLLHQQQPQQLQPQQHSTALQDEQLQQPAAAAQQQSAQVTVLQQQARLRPTPDWLHARQPVAWRCQWLFARIQELTSLIGLLQAQGSTMPISATVAGGSAPAATTPGAAAGAAAAAAGDALVSSSSATDAAEGLALLQVQQGGLLLQQHVAAVEKYGSILQSPFFAAHTAGTHAAPLPSVLTMIKQQEPVQQTQPQQQQEEEVVKQPIAQQQKQQQVDLQQREGQGDSSKQLEQQQQQSQQQQDSVPADMDVDQPAAAADGDRQQQPGQQQLAQQPATNSGTDHPEAAGTAAAAADGVTSKPAEAATATAATATAPGAAGAAAAAAAVADHECDAAVVFSSLELVEHQLVAARLMIARAFGIEVTLAPTGVRLGQYTASRVWADTDAALNPAAAGAQGPGGQKRSAAAAGLGLARGLSGVLERGPGQGRGLQREGSLAGSMKKRRVERSGAAGIAGSIDADDGVLSPSSSLPARLMERVVTSIHIPSVREIPKDEQDALSAAATAWRATVKSQGQRAGLARPPPEVRRVLESVVADEGSSSEDTSDEAYAKMHKPLEEDEHIRLCGPTGGSRKRNKNKTKQSGSKQQQGQQQQQQQQQQPPNKQPPQQQGQQQPPTKQPPPAQQQQQPPNKQPPQQQQQQQQQETAAPAAEEPSSPRPTRLRSAAADTAAAAVPVVNQPTIPVAAAANKGKPPPPLTIPGGSVGPAAANKVASTAAASPTVAAAAAAALAAAAAGTATAAAASPRVSPANVLNLGGPQQPPQQQQLLWVQQQGGQPVLMMGSPGVPVSPAALAAAATAQQQQKSGVAAAAAASGKQQANAVAAGSGGGPAARGRDQQLPSRLTSTQLASTRTNGTVAGISGASRTTGVATRTGSGGLKAAADKDTAAAAGDKSSTRDRSVDKEAPAAVSGKAAAAAAAPGKDRDAATAASSKQQGEGSRPSSGRKTVSPAAVKEDKDRSKSPAVASASKSPSAATGTGTVAAGTRRAAAAAAAAAATSKSRSSSRVKAQVAAGKRPGRSSK